MGVRTTDSYSIFSFSVSDIKEHYITTINHGSRVSCREFVSCVQSIKILSAAEVQQMSLDGDLAQLPVANQACSGTDSGNVWRAHYDDNSATSFNR